AVFIPDMITVAPPILPAPELMASAVRDAFERLLKENGLEHSPVEREIREGTPFAEIVRFAREGRFDLVVMGSHGHTGLAHVLLGSVVERVVRKAPCPVLTVRQPEHEFARP